MNDPSQLNNVNYYNIVENYIMIVSGTKNFHVGIYL